MNTSEQNTSVNIGKTESGTDFLCDIKLLPNILVGGATGSGKTQLLHNIIHTLIKNNKPNDLKFIFIDPKRVELVAYKDIPYLLTPIITDPDKTEKAYEWAAEETDRRLKGEADASALPTIIIMDDEFGEVMCKHGEKVEGYIKKIAGSSKVTGIHVILATSRIYTETFTQDINKSIPCRVAFNMVSSGDSQMFLGQTGAEKLNSKGDMLFLGPDGKEPVRLQAPFITDNAIQKLVKDLGSQEKVTYQVQF